MCNSIHKNSVRPLKSYGIGYKIFKLCKYTEILSYDTILKMSDDNTLKLYPLVKGNILTLSYSIEIAGWINWNQAIANEYDDGFAIFTDLKSASSVYDRFLYSYRDLIVLCKIQYAEAIAEHHETMFGLKKKITLVKSFRVLDKILTNEKIDEKISINYGNFNSSDTTYYKYYYSTPRYYYSTPRLILKDKLDIVFSPSS